MRASIPSQRSSAQAARKPAFTILSDYGLAWVQR